MKRTSTTTDRVQAAHEIPLDRLLGRNVLALNNQRVGRIEEFRAERLRDELAIREYVIGAAGLFERLGIGIRVLFGRKTGGYVARWDQIDISHPDRPRLTCPVAELQRV